MKYKREWSKKIFYLSAMPASLLLATNLFLYQPALLYKGNQTFFHFHFMHFWTILLPLFFIAFFLLSLPLQGLPRPWKRVYTAILSGLALLMWAASFFVGSDGQLDGKSFTVVDDGKLLILNALLLLFVGGIGITFSWYKEKLLNYFLLLICSMLLLQFAWISFFDKNESAKQWSLAPPTEFAQFSRNKNVLVILLDAFQSDFFQEIVDNNPNLLQQFSGFTYFNQAIGVAPTTYLSVPSIHSGSTYAAGQLIASFYEKSIVEDSFMALHERQGYKGFIVNPYLNYCPKQVTCIFQEQIYGNKKMLSKEAALTKEAALLLDMSLFRSIPHYFKPLVYNDKGKWLMGDILIKNPTMAEVSNQVLMSLSSKMTTNSKTPTIKFIHSFATHAPISVDENCKRVDSKAWSRKNAINQDHCAIKNVLSILNSLKKKAIYDKTAILIIADHGTGLQSATIQSYLSSASMPLFLFKPFEAKGPLQTSTQLVSLTDIPATLCAATGDCGNNPVGLNVMDDLSNQKRTFYFSRYDWKGEYANKKDSFPVVQFEVTGNPMEITSWKRIFHQGLPPIKANLTFGDPAFLTYCGVGWEAGVHSSHKPSRWASGPQSELFLPLPINHAVDIEFLAKTHLTNSGQQISVWVNNTLIGKYEVKLGRTKPIQFHIPANLILTEPTHIVFKFDKWNRPIHSADKRALAVNFEGPLKISLT